MNRNFWTFIAVCAAGGFALVLLAVMRPAPSATIATAEPMTLRVHPVPPARADDILNALAISLAMGDGQPAMGRVSGAGPGKLLVLAPEGVQADVARAIEVLGGDLPKAETPMTIALDVWSVDAVPGTGSDDPALASIATALDATRATLGSVRFEQRHALSVLARGDGSSFSVETPGRPVAPEFGATPFRLNGNLRSTDNGVTTRLALAKPSVETTIDLQYGETVVLAQVAANDGRTQVLVARARPADARG